MSEIDITKGESDMDAFKELVARSPDVELMKIDELHGLVFWSGAAMKWAKTQIGIAKELGGLNAQIDAWAEEGNAAAELNFKARAKRGELAKNTTKTFGGTQVVERDDLGRTVKLKSRPSGEPPKWQRLGYKSEQAMKDDEFLHNNPEIVEEVKKQAKEAGDFPSVTAVKNEHRARRAEEMAEKAKERADKKKGEETNKEVEENKRFVAEYFNTIRAFTKEIEKAIIGAGKGKFDPAGKNFVIEKHNKVKSLMMDLEESI